MTGQPPLFALCFFMAIDPFYPFGFAPAVLFFLSQVIDMAIAVFDADSKVGTGVSAFVYTLIQISLDFSCHTDIASYHIAHFIGGLIQRL